MYQNTQMTVALRFMCALLLYFPPSTAQEILSMSYQDVMIIRSDFLAGKPLHMHFGTNMVHLCIHLHPCQNPKYYESSEPLHLFPNPFSVPGTCIYIYSCISTYIQRYVHLHSYIHICMHVYIYTFLHAFYKLPSF